LRGIFWGINVFFHLYDVYDLFWWEIALKYIFLKGQTQDLNDGKHNLFDFSIVLLARGFAVQEFTKKKKFPPPPKKIVRSYKP